MSKVKAELEKPENDGALFTSGVTFEHIKLQAEDHHGNLFGVVGLSKFPDETYSTPIAVEDIEEGVTLLSQDDDKFTLTRNQLKSLRDLFNVILGE